ncbi:hypothetical protein GCM10007291_42150 [Gemmobacter nanjingensis]|uniref:Uncharacterized protein n=1 Tax=Gemmobacter nanjingensis TaxID=488454 RepID=A0ABQ3FRM2_9RHOB|nr:hypothetical protein [Gemmobacter nanjingensis]GHC36265.1 hypothetical protein GCM10007291_42150 [Gemmobacter nanjingensis]
MKIIRDGVLQIRHGARSLPVMFRRAGQIRAGARHVLVVFNGALTTREGRQPPFFVGATLADDLGLPRIAFSDPTLELNEELLLSFYAGHAGFPDLAQTIAGIIDDLAATHGFRPILVGGSGGGYAALNIGRRMHSDPFILVWNPQTDIARYVPAAVAAYVATAFPAEYDADTHDAAATTRILDAALGTSRLMPWECQAQTLLLQNRSDWHTEHHALPFVTSFPHHQVAPGHFCGTENATAVSLLDWGQGHIAPPRDLLMQTLDLILTGASAEAVQEALASGAASARGFIGKQVCRLDGPEALQSAPIHLEAHLAPGRKYRFSYSLDLDGAAQVPEDLRRSALVSLMSGGDPAVDIPGLMRSPIETIGFYRYIAATPKPCVQNFHFTLPAQAAFLTLRILPWDCANWGAVLRDVTITDLGPDPGAAAGDG